MILQILKNLPSLRTLHLAELASKSIIELLGKTKIQKAEIDGLIVSSSSNESYLGNIISEMIGIKPKFSTKVENLCNSGTSGIMLGLLVNKIGTM